MEPLDPVIGNSLIKGEYFLREREILDFPWRKTEFIEAKISGGSMTDSLFEDCIFKNTIFENIYLDHVDFVRCRFENFQIINCSREWMEMRECTGSPPTLIGTKEPPLSRNNKPFPPGWGPETEETAKQ
jgi:hypothetical protein